MALLVFVPFGFKDVFMEVNGGWQDSVSPEESRAQAVWVFAKWLCKDPSLEQDDYTVTIVKEALGEIMRRHTFVFDVLVLRHGICDGFNYSMQTIAELCDCPLSRVEQYYNTGLQFILRKLDSADDAAFELA